MPDEKCHPLIQLFNVPLQVTRSHLNKQTNKKPKTPNLKLVKVEEQKGASRALTFLGQMMCGANMVARLMADILLTC